MGVLIFLLLVLFIAFLIWGKVLNDANTRRLNHEEKQEMERISELREATLLDSKHEIIRINQYKLNDLLKSLAQPILTQKEEEYYINECEIWKSSDGQTLCINPLGVCKYMAIPVNNIINITSEIFEYQETEEIHDFDFDEPKAGFDVGGAIIGTIIAGTPGTIIGGMHNMGKESPKKAPKTRMTTEYDVYYFLNYIGKKGKQYRFVLDDLALDSWRKILPDEWRVHDEE